MSEENRIFAQEVDLKDALNVSIAGSSEKTIEIYGENHANTLNPKKNTFIELVDKIMASDDEDKPLVLVEHATVLCNLRGIGPKQRQIMLSRGGSETMFLKLMEADYPNLVCYDNRIESGLLSAVEEQRYFAILNELIKTPVVDKSDELFATLVGVCKEIITRALYIQKKILPTFVDPFDDLIGVYIQALNSQIKILLGIIQSIPEDKIDFKARTIIPQLTNWQFFIKTQEFLLINIRRVGGIFADLNAIKLIKKSKNKNVLVFGGLDHALRISSYYEGKDDEYDFAVLKSYKRNILEALLPVNNPDRDAELIAIIKSQLVDKKTIVKKTATKKTVTKKTVTKKTGSKSRSKSRSRSKSTGSKSRSRSKSRSKSTGSKSKSKSKSKTKSKTRE